MADTPEIRSVNIVEGVTLHSSSGGVNDAFGLTASAHDALIQKRLEEAGKYDPNIPKVRGSFEVSEAAVEHKLAL